MFEINMEGEGRTVVGRQEGKEQEGTIFLKTPILTVMMLKLFCFLFFFSFFCLFVYSLSPSLIIGPGIRKDGTDYVVRVPLNPF